MPQLKAIKSAIWVYFWLLLLEGVLRKWVLPQFSDAIFVVRDPIVCAIYAMALWARVFPIRPALIVLALIAVLSLVFALGNDAPPIVAMFGLRTNYLHVPLVFVMAQVLDRDDVIRFGRWTLVMSVPILALMWMQFASPPGAWVNRAVAGTVGGQLRGAMGHIRPPGPFSFVSGVVVYFALVASFALHGWLERGSYSRALVWMTTLVIVLAVPISVSRSLLFAVLVVGAFGLAAAARDFRRLPVYLGPIVAGLAVLALMSDTVVVQTYRTRWEESMEGGGGGFNKNVLERMGDEFVQPFEIAGTAPLLGHGIGMGTVAGARMITGKYTFLLAESELARIVLELGPILGFAFIGWRLWLAVMLVALSWQSVRKDGNALPWLLTGACFLNVLDGQWGPSTNLGFAVFVAGLALAAANRPASESETAAA